MQIDPPRRVRIPWYPRDHFDGQSERFWEISVAPTDSLEWCVLLSHLKSCKTRSAGVFKSRLGALSSKEKNTEEVKRSIDRFNPFLNRHSCFYGDSSLILSEIVSEFKQKLGSVSCAENSTLEKKLSRICDLLNCDVQFITDADSCASDNKTRVYQTFRSYNANSSYTIFLTVDSAESNTFKFLLSDEFCKDLREDALRGILGRTELSKSLKRKINKMFRKHGDHLDDFVSYLVQSKLRSSISQVYQYPYVAHQLASAGFETDPRSPDMNGNSAFYHAFQSKNNELVYALYRYAANGCHSTWGTYRNPDTNIVTNFFDLKELIKKESENVRDMSRGLLNLNEFLLKLDHHLLKIVKHVNYNDKWDDEEFVTLKKLRKMSTILNIYDECFWIETSEISLSVEDNYSLHEFYYNVLDYSAAFFFFDNVFILKKFLSFPHIDTHCCELENSFFFLLLSYKYFPSEINIDNVKYGNFLERPSLLIESNGNVNLSRFRFLERCQLHKKIKYFCSQLDSILEKHQILKTKKKLRKCNCKIGLQEQCIWSNVIKDEFIMCRVQYYTSIALNAKFLNSKAILSIQRALQVLGESLKFDSQNPDSFSHFLRASLPEHVEDTLNDIRNSLSHYSTEKFAEKINAEKNTRFFRAIQLEIKEIINAFDIVIEMQKKRVLEFFGERWKSLIEMSRTTSNVNEMKLDLASVSELEDWFDDKRKDLFSNIDYYNNFFEEKSGLTSLEQNKIQEILNFRNIIITDDVEKRAKEWKENYQKTDLYKKFRPLSGQHRSRNKNNILSTSSSESPKFYKDDEILESPLKTLANSYFEFPISDNKGKPFYINYVETDDGAYFSKRKASFNKSGSFNSPTKAAIRKQSRSNSRDHLPKSPWRINPYTCWTAELSAFFRAKNFDQKLAIEAFELSQSKDGRNSCQNSLFKNGFVDLMNLVNRIQLLEQILFQNHYCRNLWMKGHSRQAHETLISKIAHRYCSEPDFQASVEMLLFDCRTILEECRERPQNKRKRKSAGKNVSVNLVYLWQKTRKLYSGVNMRNVLAHGHFLLESVSEFLDPDDVPSELAMKLLELVRDKEALHAMGQLWLSVDFVEELFEEIVECDGKDPSKYSPEQIQMRSKIVKCNKWKDYYNLMLKRN